jgi:hypothetical protein
VNQSYRRVRPALLHHLLHHLRSCRLQVQHMDADEENVSPTDATAPLIWSSTSDGQNSMWHKKEMWKFLCQCCFVVIGMLFILNLLQLLKPMIINIENENEVDASSSSVEIDIAKVLKSYGAHRDEEYDELPAYALPQRELGVLWS